MVEYLGNGFTMDVNGALEWIKRETKSRERDVLKYQIKRYSAGLGK